MITYKDFLNELKAFSNLALAEYDGKVKEASKRLKSLDDRRVELEKEIEILRQGVSVQGSKADDIVSKARAEAQALKDNAAYVCDQQYSEMEKARKQLKLDQEAYASDKAELDKSQRGLAAQLASVTELWDEAQDVSAKNEAQLIELRTLKDDISILNEKNKSERESIEKEIKEVTKVRDQAQQATKELLKQRDILETQTAAYRADLANLNKAKAIFEDKKHLASLSTGEIQAKINELKVEGEKVKKLKKDLDDKERALKAMQT